jgi:hypothetical protein
MGLEQHIPIPAALWLFDISDQKFERTSRHVMIEQRMGRLSCVVHD